MQFPLYSFFLPSHIERTNEVSLLNSFRLIMSLLITIRRLIMPQASLLMLALSSTEFHLLNFIYLSRLLT